MSSIGLVEQITNSVFLVSKIMVGLPSAENREKILRTLLAKEYVEDLNFEELGAMTKGYSGSDLKDYSQQPSAQELIAKDPCFIGLTEWRVAYVFLDSIYSFCCDFLKYYFGLNFSYICHA